MFKKVKNIISKTDRFLFKKFGSDRSTKLLENIREAQIIFSHLNEIGKETVVRFVGGCVRKVLNGEIIDDIDLATSLEPNEVKKRLSKGDIKVIDTGISHGTLTAILNQKKFEITTLRKDVSTDGRHANVQFTLDWEQDASRRDFTINAIYADIDGRIFDPLNGISDLRNGIIKFIGSNEKRIQEDYLRILRYFRFFTQYSKINHDQDTISAIKKNINGLNNISNERIFDELKKILSLKNAYNLFLNSQSKEIILDIFPQFKFNDRLKNFGALNQKLKNRYDYKLILALLDIDQTDNYEFFCYKYKVSNNIKEKFLKISKNFSNLKNEDFFSEKNIRKLIYFEGKDAASDVLLFSGCANINIRDLNLLKLLNFINVCKIPEFPISGNDLKKHGYKSGKELGKKLKLLETKWIENNFVIDKKLIEKSLNKIN